MSRASQPINKWIPITIIAVLVVALAVTATLMGMKISKLNGQIKDANTQIAGLQSQLSNALSNASSLQAQLTQEKSKTTSLQADLTSAKNQVDSLNKNVASLQQTSNQQATQIKTMSYSRSFATIDELTNWLQKNNPIDPNFKSESAPDIQLATMSLSLEIRAARDGYLLPVALPFPSAGTVNLRTITNRAIVGNQIYDVRAYDNFVQPGGTTVPAMPSYPIPPPAG